MPERPLGTTKLASNPKPSNTCDKTHGHMGNAGAVAPLKRPSSIDAIEQSFIEIPFASDATWRPSRNDTPIDLVELFSHYGYLMLLVGSLGEGMPIMLFGGFAAHRGWLELIPSVIVVGALGNALAQSIWFFGARRVGGKILEKRTDWAARRRTHWSLAEEMGGAGDYRRPLHSGHEFSGACRGRALRNLRETFPDSQYDWRIDLGGLAWRPRLHPWTGCGGLIGDMKSYEKPVAVVLLFATAIWVAWRHLPRTWFVGRNPVER